MWGLLFVGLVAALYAATQHRAAPQIILFVFLYVVVLNFGQPAPHGRLSLAPLLALASLLMLGLQPALMALASGLVLAEISRPIWQSMGQLPLLGQPRWGARLGQVVGEVAVLWGASALYQAEGGQAPLQLPAEGQWTALPLLPLLWLGAGYAGLLFLLHLGLHVAHGRTLRQFGREILPALAAFGLISQPLAWLWALSFVAIGLPALVIFGAGIAGFALAYWLSWQSRMLLREQVSQFAQLNEVGKSLRETLDLPTVLSRTWAQVHELIPADQFTIALRDEAGGWEQALLVVGATGEQTHLSRYVPDDLTQWVGENGRTLELNPNNQHYAAQHKLILPNPAPDTWLGVPLTTSERPIGVLVIQRYPPSAPLSQWSRELLLAIAQQASGAIQNARLYTRTDEALARRVEQLQALLNAIHDGVVMMDGEGRVAQRNPVAAEWLAVPPLGERLVDAPTAVARLGYTAEALTARLANWSHLPRTPQSTIYALEEGGRTVFAERTEAAVWAEDGRIMGWLLLVRDVTEAEERAQWRTQFTHMIVHDLRNPISTLMSSMQLLEGQLTAEQPRQLVTVSQQVSGQMLDMVDSLMDINLMEAGRFTAEVEAMRLPLLVGRVVQAVEPLAASKQISLHLEVAEGLPAVWADEVLVRRMVVNLLDNALKFTPGGGWVVVQLTAEPAEDAAVAEAGVRCTIADTGPGIPAAYKEHIFERFVRISTGGAQVRGTGVGLYFCKLAVEAQGGRLWVEDAAVGGSAFVFTLPGVPLF